jgi:hypothetical protein
MLSDQHQAGNRFDGMLAVQGHLAVLLLNLVCLKPFLPAALYWAPIRGSSTSL